MKKKKVLFILAKASSGGSCTSMLNLLELLKERGCVIDLFLMSHEGEFLSRAKSVANLIPESSLIASIITNKDLIISFKSSKKLFFRVFYFFMHKLFGAENITSFFYKTSANYLSSKYHTVVAYQESMTSEYVQYIKADKKIAWVHNDYDKFATNREASMIYNSFDKIVCVSKSVKKSILDNIDSSISRTELIYNSLVTDNIITGSKVYLETLKREDSTIILVSVGRFAQQKGFERIIEIANKLIADKFKFKWYLVGDGELWDVINRRVKENKLDQYIILLGNMENPYPVIKFADFMVLTSIYEAHPMVVNEALILHKPVISTSFNSVKEIIEHGVTGLICENSINGVYEGIKMMILDERLRVSIQSNVNNFKYSNDEILYKVNKLLYE